MMNSEIVILLAEDDMGHATLFQKSLKRSGITNPIIHFKDGEEVLNFLFKRGDPHHRVDGEHYLLLLDIRMPKADGIEVLEQIKAHEELNKLYVTMLTAAYDPMQIDRCHKLGCKNYIIKPIDHKKFVEAVRKLGLFISVVKVTGEGFGYTVSLPIKDGENDGGEYNG